MTLIQNALKCKNFDRPPVWLMRQAGRILPSYRSLREKYTLDELFQNSDLAAEVTKLPLDILGVDAAILFTDIMMIAKLFGFKLKFVEKVGPVIEPLLQRPEDIQQMKPEGELDIVKETISLLKPTLNVPLIGFCGGPFTVARYLVKDKKWFLSDPKMFHLLLEKLTAASIDYLKMQIKAGVNAVQIFDSWANALTREEFLQFSLPYLKKIVGALKETQIPVIVFCRGSSLLPEELSSIQPDAISFDWHQEMQELRKKVPSTIAVQGNIDPEILKGPRALIESSVKKLLTSMEDDPGFIVNLGHGVLPDTPLDNVKYFIDLVKQ
ncbi:MAG TPA: uroporphyrinogen decarboxylase [Rhabdochlamydiaceae bacterium]|nr:uroporphyrinogen decarboxylase [Rhabdochlamydiaceae bacterium]